MWNGTETKIIEVFFIRHGATEGNLSQRYIGRTEECLCNQGKEQLRHREKEEVNIVFSSPMRRCLETTEFLFPEKNPHIIEEWREMDFGIFEGKNYQELNGDPDYQAWIDSNGVLPFPEGESRDAFQSRTILGMEKMFQKMLFIEAEADKGMENSNENKQVQPMEKVACVVHGGTIMAILSHDSGEDYFSFQCKNGEGYRCIYEIKGTKRRLLSYEKEGN